MKIEAIDPEPNETPNSKHLCVDVGGLWEDQNFDIFYDMECPEAFGTKPCRHCSNVKDREHTRFDGSKWTEKVWTCSRVVVATNEGGCSNTGVCLDCILEAAAIIDKDFPHTT